MFLLIGMKAADFVPVLLVSLVKMRRGRNDRSPHLTTGYVEHAGAETVRRVGSAITQISRIHRNIGKDRLGSDESISGNPANVDVAFVLNEDGPVYIIVPGYSIFIGTPFGDGADGRNSLIARQTS